MARRPSDQEPRGKALFGPASAPVVGASPVGPNWRGSQTGVFGLGGIGVPVRRIQSRPVVSLFLIMPEGWRAPPYKWTWVNFHTFRHTWATWMRRYAGADVEALVATGNWRDRRSAARYAHAVAKDERNQVERLPDIAKKAKL
jgi:integrase